MSSESEEKYTFFIFQIFNKSRFYVLRFQLRIKESSFSEK